MALEKSYYFMFWSYIFIDMFLKYILFWVFSAFHDILKNTELFKKWHTFFVNSGFQSYIMYFNFCWLKYCKKIFIMDRGSCTIADLGSFSEKFGNCCSTHTPAVAICSWSFKTLSWTNHTDRQCFRDKTVLLWKQNT